MAGNGNGSGTWRDWLFNNNSSHEDSGDAQVQVLGSSSSLGRRRSSNGDKHKRKGKGHAAASLSHSIDAGHSSSLSLGGGHSFSRGSRSSHSEGEHGEARTASSSSDNSDSDSIASSSASASSSARARREIEAEGLLWEAQMALISHEYGSALRKLRRAVKYRSPAACLSLGNILSKGMTACSDSHSHSGVKPDIVQAGRYYCQGLEYENARSDTPEGEHLLDHDHDHQELLTMPDDTTAATASTQLNTEVIMDIAHGLCLLYRHGKIRPDHEHECEHDKESERSREKGKGRAHEGSHHHNHTSMSTWERGGRIALPLIAKLERLLGLVFPDFLDELDPAASAHVTEEPESLLLDDHVLPPQSPPSLESRHTSPDPASRPGHVNGQKKSVSFSKLPARRRALTTGPAGTASLLDAVSSRQARSALVHLWYIAALCAFSEGDNAHAHRAGKMWEKIVLLAEEQGTGSKEADEIVDKARARLGMLAADRAAQEQQPVARRNNKEEKGQQLSLHHLLSPVDTLGRPKEVNGFDFGPDKPALSSSKPPAEAEATGTQDLAKAIAEAHIPSSVPTAALPKQSASALLKPPRPGRRQSAKFALHDSPTSVRSGKTSHERGQGSPTKQPQRRPSNASALGGGAPWMVRSPSSSTGLSFSGSAQQRELSRSTGPGPGAGLPSAAPVNRQALFRPSRSRLGPGTQAAPPSLALSDASASNLSYVPPAVSSDFDLRRNASSVASLPHYSTGTSTAHLLLSRSQASSTSLRRPPSSFSLANSKRQGSSASLASLASSIAPSMKSFSSLRSFFTSAPAPVPAEEEDPAAKLKARLRAAAERHDAAIAEMENWGYAYYTGDAEEEEPEESPAPPSFDSDRSASAGMPLPQVQSTPPRAAAAMAMPGGSADSSGRKSLRFSTSIPSSSLLQPTRRISNSPSAAAGAAPSATAGAGATAKVSPQKRRLARRRDLSSREFFERDPTSASVTPQASSANLRSILPHDDLSSGSITPLGEHATGIKVDPLLAALEAASRVNVKSRCAVCGKSGVNFPKCQKCGMTFCSRECRIASGGDEGLRLGKHVC